MRIFSLKKVCGTVFLTFFILLNASAQFDTLFWFAAPEVSHGGGNFDRPIGFKISTQNQSSIVTVDFPANPLISPIIVSIPSNDTREINLTMLLDSVENKPANTVLNKGIRIRASQPVTVYYEIVSTFCNCNPEIFSLKGKTALGRVFYTPFQNTFSNSSAYNPQAYSSIDIVATEDSTTVFITPSNHLVGHLANIRFSVFLHKGETYSATALSQNSFEHLGGTKLESDKPIAVTIKDDLLQVSTSADVAGDQIIPIDMLGREYVVPKGSFTQGDKVYILAISDSTDIIINGTISARINEGQTYVHSVLNTQVSAYIQSTKNIYVLHLTGLGAEVGMALLPPVECTGSLQVGFTRSLANSFFLTIMVESGGENSFVLNNNSTAILGTSFNNVPGSNGKWKVATLSFNTATIPVGQSSVLSNNQYPFHMGLIHGTTGGGSRYGYFSDFAILVAKIQTENSRICFGDTLKMFTQVKDSSTYKWSGPNNFSTDSSYFFIPNSSFANSGKYFLEVSSKNCGTVSDSIFVDIIHRPVPVSNVYSNSPLCENETLTLSANSDSLSVLIWQKPNLDTLMTSIFEIKEVSQVDTGKYLVFAKDTSGLCVSDTVVIDVPIFNKRNKPVLFNDRATICSGNKLEINVTEIDTIGADSVVWITPQGRFFYQGDFVLSEIEFTDSGMYILVVYDSGPCGNFSDTIQVTIAPLPPPPSPLVANTPICIGDTILIFAGTQNLLYRTVWTRGNNDTLVSNPFNLLITNAQLSDMGMYYAQILNIESGCFSPKDSIKIEVGGPSPKPTILALEDSLCENQSLVLKHSLSLGFTDSLFWESPSSVFYSDSLVLPSVLPSDSGLYVLHYFQEGTCAPGLDSFWLQVFEYPKLTSASILRISPICEGQEQRLSVLPTNPMYTYTWQGPASFEHVGSSFIRSNAQFSFAGIYNLSIANGPCIFKDTLKTNYAVHSMPKADFMFSSPFASVGVPFRFINNSTKASFYRWDFGDLTAPSTEENPSHTYLSEANRVVSLIAINDSLSCMDTIQKAFWVFNEEQILIPSSFSPNQDGLNEEFSLYINGVKEYRMEVYNRWGEKIFDSEIEKKLSWDGSFSGKPCQQDIYVVILYYTDRLNERKSTKKTVQLLR